NGEFEDRKIPEALLILDELNKLDENKQVSNNKPKILREQLYLDGNEIVKRDANDIKFRGEKTPKLSSFESVLKILNREEDIAPAYRGLANIIYSSQSNIVEGGQFVPVLLDDYEARYTTLESIQDSDLPTIIKLGLAFRNVPEVFQ